MWFFGTRKNELEQDHHAGPDPAESGAIQSSFSRPKTVGVGETTWTRDRHHNSGKDDLITSQGSVGIASFADQVHPTEAQRETPTTSVAPTSPNWEVTPGGTLGPPAGYRYQSECPTAATIASQPNADEGVPEQENAPSRDGLAMFFEHGPRWFISTGLPMEDFRLLQIATSEKEREAARSEFYRAVCKYIETIGTAEHRLSRGFTDCLMVLLLPDEKMLVEVSGFEKSIFKIAEENSVVIATPQSLVTVVEGMMSFGEVPRT